MNAPQRWHLPRFAGWDCSGKEGMTDRERLGLPAHFVETPLQAEVAQATTELRQQPAGALLALIEDGALDLARRIAAGNLLALAGDPRIDPLAPEMIDIPGGDVTIGLDADEVDAVLARHERLGLSRSWIEKEVPRHRLRLAPYRLARYPVTNADYRQFLLESGDEEIPTSWAFRRYPAEKANHPVHTVTARAAQAYCDWLGARTGRAMRLPTEAEWEYAAAGPQGREFPWGEHFDPALANTAECGLLDTSPVGVFVGAHRPSAFATWAAMSRNMLPMPMPPIPAAPRCATIWSNSTAPIAWRAAAPSAALPTLPAPAAAMATTRARRPMPWGCASRRRRSEPSAGHRPARRQ
jgi:hypothetical protein